MEVLFVNAFILFLATATVYYYYFTSKLKRPQKIMLTKEKLFNNIKYFSPIYTFVFSNNKIGIAIDKESKKICLIENPTGSFPVELRLVRRLIVSYRDILKLAIVENGYTIIKKSIFNQFLCLLFGSLAAKKRIITNVKSLELKITINNNQHPLWVIPFLRNETKNDTFIYKNALERVNKLHSLIKLLTKQAESDNFLQQTTPKQNNHDGQKETVSIVEQLEKLLESNKQGVVTKQKINTLEARCCSCHNLYLAKENTAEAASREQRNLLELAKQANPEAITILMNRSLQPKGIIGKAILKNGCLQIMLESAQVPDKLAMGAFIRKGIANLGAKSIKTVRVYGRRAGEKFPAWTQEFEC